MEKYQIVYTDDEGNLEEWQDADVKTVFPTRDEAMSYIINMIGFIDTELDIIMINE